jgi:hypothetical protein
MTQLTSTWPRPGGKQLTAVHPHRTSRHRRQSPQLLHLQIRKRWVHMTHCTHQEHWALCHTLPAPSPTSGEAKGPFPSGVSPTSGCAPGSCSRLVSCCRAGLNPARNSARKSATAEQRIHFSRASSLLSRSSDLAHDLLLSLFDLPTHLPSSTSTPAHRQLARLIDEPRRCHNSAITRVQATAATTASAKVTDPELHTTAPARGKTYSDHELLRATDLRQRLAAPALSNLDESQKKGI